jgi:hypothetical protein
MSSGVGRFHSVGVQISVRRKVAMQVLRICKQYAAIKAAGEDKMKTGVAPVTIMHQQTHPGNGCR